MSGGLFSVGGSALGAAYMALQTTSHNIANVNTPGYSRQTVIQRAASSQFSGAGSIGRGVEVATVQRAYSDIMSAQADQATSVAAQFRSEASLMSRLESLFGDTESNINGTVDGFFGALTTLAGNSGSSTARSAVLSRADLMATEFNRVGQGLTDLANRASDELTASVTSVNQYTYQLAKLNDQIVLATGRGQPPNDLLDQRDQLVRQLSQEMRVTTNVQPDGSLSVFAGNGQPLVVAGVANKMLPMRDAQDPSRLGIAITAYGETTPIGQELIAGGKIAGILGFANDKLNPAANELGKVALSIASQLNERHAMGVTPSGQAGQPMFTTPPLLASNASTNTGNAVFAATVEDTAAFVASDYQVDFDGSNYTVTRLTDKTVNPAGGMPQSVDGLTFSIASGSMAAGDVVTLKPFTAAANDIRVNLSSPDKLALGLPIQAKGAAGNSGIATVASLSVASADPNSTASVTIRFTGPGTFDVTGAGTGNPVGVSFSADSISYNGWTLKLNGTPRAGDEFTVAASAAQPNDNRNALALSDLTTTRFSGGRSPTKALSEIVGRVGTEAAAAQGSATAFGRVATSVEAEEQSLEGVNLDEEAARLVQQQQAYQAAAKIIQTAQSIFEEILSIGR